MKLLALVLGALFALPAFAQIPAAAAKYRAQLTREARMVWGLQAPVSTYAAQLQQESGWNPNAHSNVGAAGLAQFMPATALWIGKVYPRDVGPAAPLDAAWSLRAIVYYDHMLYGQVSSFQEGIQRWAAALSAYNGGLGWVYKDEKLAPACAARVWFQCVENTIDGRSAANLKQNRDYPRRILLLYKPRYDAAGWR